MSLVARIAIWTTGIAAVLAVVLGVVAWQEGYRVYVIHTGSMTPTYNPGDIVIDRPPNGIRIGQVITFHHSDLTTDVVTHRIVFVDGNLIHTKGDGNRTADVWRIRPDQVRGVVTASVPDAGYVLVFFRQATGAASVVLALVALALLWNLFFPDDPEIAPSRPLLPLRP